MLDKCDNKSYAIHRILSSFILTYVKDCAAGGASIGLNPPATKHINGIEDPPHDFKVVLILNSYAMHRICLSF